LSAQVGKQTETACGFAGIGRPRSLGEHGGDSKGALMRNNREAKTISSEYVNHGII
jgi:hypothetical protein